MNQKEMKRLFDNSDKDVYCDGIDPWYNEKSCDNMIISCITYNAHQFTMDYDKYTREYFYIKNRGDILCLDEIIYLAPTGDRIFERWKKEFMKTNNIPD